MPLSDKLPVVITFLDENSSSKSPDVINKRVGLSPVDNKPCACKPDTIKPFNSELVCATFIAEGAATLLSLLVHESSPVVELNAGVNVTPLLPSLPLGPFRLIDAIPES